MRRHLGSPRRRLGEATVLGGQWRVKGKARALGVLGVVFGLAACAQPAFVPDAPGGAGPMLQGAFGLLVAVDANVWNGRPSGLTDTVLPLFVL